MKSHLLRQPIVLAPPNFDRRQGVPPSSIPGALPIAAHQQEIIHALKTHDVIIVAGETGSGKSTQLAKLCLQAGRGIDGMIGHTQPRRLAARSIAKRVSEELGQPQGKAVGYKIRFSDQTHEQTYIKLMTDGILLAELQQDKMLSQYDTLIIDEAHERSLNIDFLLGHLKQLIQKRDDLKIIITSATINVEAFSKHYFDAPIINVSGRTYPVAIEYAPMENELGVVLPQAEAIAEAADLLLKTQTGDILVFVSGEREIREACEFLQAACSDHIDVLPLFSRLNTQQQDKIFNPNSKRRIIVATNVAETSLTVPRIHCVIDCGYARVSRYNYRAKVQRLPIEKISQASANQRAGRCGRIAPGMCVRLYDEQDYLSRPEFTEPEIMRTNLATVVLQMQAWRLGNIENFPFLQAPDPRYVQDGVRLLKQLRALDAKGHITGIGKQLARLPVDPRLGAVLLAGKRFSCVQQMLVICSYLSVGDPRERPFDKQGAADKAHEQFIDKSSDFVAILNLWQLSADKRAALSRKQWQSYCRKNFLSQRRLQEWREIYKQLERTLKDMKVPVNETPFDYQSVHSALLTGFVDYIAQKDEKKGYVGARQAQFSIFPGSGLKNKPPAWIIAGNLLETQKLYAHTVAQIQPEWVLSVAQHLVKRHYSEPHWSSKRMAVMAYERVSLYGLVLTDRQNVNYERIDPVVSREIFIREGLVNAQLTLSADFYAHNQACLQAWHDAESRVRRIDVVDEQKLYAFYDQRLPQDVVNKTSLLSWIKHEPEADQRLHFNADMFVDEDTQQQIEDQYPDVFSYDQAQFKMQYHFEPGHPRDGASVFIPQSLATKLKQAPFEWLVPGLRFEKVETLLRALPKAVRRQLTPIPDCVDKFLASTSVDGSFYTVLTNFLQTEYAALIHDQKLREIKLPEHLLMNFIITRDEEEIAEGRDLNALIPQISEQASSLKPLNSDKWSRPSVTSWNFQSLPVEVTLTDCGQDVMQYPALVDQVNNVSIELFNSSTQAQHKYDRGVTRLFLFMHHDKKKYMQKRSAELKTAQLGLGHWAGVEDVLEQALFAVIFSMLPEVPVRTKAQFESWSNSLSPNLIDHTQKLINTLAAMVPLLQETNKKWQAMELSTEEVIAQEIEAQWSALFMPDFIAQTPIAYLKRYPLYLQALQRRLQKMPAQWQKHRDVSRIILVHWMRYERLKANPHALASHSDEIEHYRWMIEEYRLSCSAEQLKTKFPISEKRLEKQWLSLSHLG